MLLKDEISGEPSGDTLHGYVPAHLPTQHVLCQRGLHHRQRQL